MRCPKCTNPMLLTVLGNRNRQFPYWRCLICGTYVEAEQGYLHAQKWKSNQKVISKRAETFRIDATHKNLTSKKEPLLTTYY